MKSQGETTTQKNLHARTRVRVGITLAGIVTAILCTIALVYETPSLQRKPVVPRLIETSTLAATGWSAATVSRVAVTAIWPF